jgi:hypothetical protein
MTTTSNEPDTAFLEPNRHFKASGASPAWTTTPREPGERRSYFEGTCGDQWVASATKQRFLLTGGDIGWETTRVENPEYAVLLAQLATYEMWSGFQGLILAAEERHWLTAVLLAAQAARQ